MSLGVFIPYPLLFISYSPLFHFLPFTFFIPLGGIFMH
jgi:hypothetical protein